MSYVTMSALCEEITRHVGGLEKQRAIMGKKTEETWKADAKPAEKEPKWELLFRKASPLLLKSAHLPCSFLTNSLCRSPSAMVSLRASSMLLNSAAPSHPKRIPQGIGHECFGCCFGCCKTSENMLGGGGSQMECRMSRVGNRNFAVTWLIG